MMDFLTLAHERYSCRKLTDEPVSDDDLAKLLEAARVAPTGKNLQPWHLWVLRSEEALSAARSCTKCHWNASLILVLGARSEDGWVRPADGRAIADVDATIVGTHILLEAADLGLGCTWVAWFDAPRMQELFPQMQGYDLVGMFPLGHPAPDATPSPRHTQSKDLGDLVTSL